MKIIDKYISSKFWKFFLMALLAFILVFVIVDLVENLDRYIDKGAKAFDVFEYYIFFLPYIIALVIPIATLLATAFLGGYLVKNRELVALRSAGISTLRVTSTIIMWGVFLSIFVFVLGEFILPGSNYAKDELKRTKIDKKSSNTARLKNQLFYIAEDGAIYYFRVFDAKSKLGRDVVILKKNNNDEIYERIDAKRMKWTGFGWRLTDVIRRNFSDGNEKLTRMARMELNISEKPEDFARKIPKPEEMGIVELSKFIAKIKKSGIEPKREETDLWMKFAYPLVNIIVVILGIPLVFKQRKGSYIYGFGQSFFIAFLYLAALRAGQTLGYNGTLSPWFAAFAGNILFGSVGIVLLWFSKD
ncbi:hypothetical protein DRQ29_01735 [bacterium]|nr:MAG: hypothetical protein DRQ29_01735 [bacterium]